MQWKLHVRFGGRAAETHPAKPDRALRSDPYTEHPTGEGRPYCCLINHTYNRRRRQRGLGRLTPVKFEIAFTTRSATAEVA